MQYFLVQTIISRFSASFRLWIHGSYSRDSSKNNAPLIPLRLITLTDSDSSLVTRSCIVVLLVFICTYIGRFLNLTSYNSKEFHCTKLIRLVSFDQASRRIIV